MKLFAVRYGLDKYVFEVRSAMTEEQGITNFVRSENPDLIAMGTHGRRGLAHLFAGSIAEDVVNHLDCPIWTCVMQQSIEASRKS
jgi:nucleotide-binding universal stress UspA family protein